MSELDETIERLCVIHRKGMQSFTSGWRDWCECGEEWSFRAGMRAVYEAVLADLRPMPDRLDVANALNNAVYGGDHVRIDDWCHVRCALKLETEAMLELFTGRTDADYERLKTELEAAEAKALEFDAMTENFSKATKKAESERDALATELESLKSNTAEPTDDEVERLCEVYVEGEREVNPSITPWKEMTFNTQYGRAGIRAVARELPRLPYQPPEGVTLEGLQDVINKHPQQWEASFVLDYLGITLPTAPTVELNGPQTAEQLREALNQLEQAS